ncbi:putative drug exporter of the RND superfamily [Sanguibacter gelidistatuariae]|uniref:Putative drug exporter of the RND superfamily n=1 Tax=Sanguibacter gelidistatuariae TaxID=1814289 RepID=A0A1G6S7K9_9MICO|nr:MMPL family transporter [Sanguibacter gelidistatuariae]SDD12155.1 putative drug exporter of the RND superfamily [Sanguibacter gelidistatuariae]
MSRIAGWITHPFAKWVVIGFWVVVALALSPLAGKLTAAQDNDAKSWLPASAESTQVLNIASSFTSPNTIPAVVVYVRESGLTPQDLAKVTADAATFGALGTLDGKVTGPIPSEDGQAAQVIVPLDLGSEGWNLAADAVASLRATAEQGADGLQVYVTGPAGQAADSSKAFQGIESTLLYAAAGVVIIILLLTYRSPILWLLPLITAGVALTVAQAVIYVMVGHTTLTVNAQSAGILTVLVFGAGTDYALLLIARYREELRRHSGKHEAMSLALHRAAPAIAASGATVAVGMLCLLFAQMRSTSGLGPVAAIGIIVALLVTLTLLPALLVACGRWVFWPRVPHLGDPQPSEHGMWARVGQRISHAPRRTWVVTSLILAVLSIGIVQLNANGLTSAESFRGEQPSIAGEQVLAEHFPAGTGSPVVVVSDAAAASAVRAAFAGVEGIEASSVSEPVVVGGHAYMEGTLTSEPDSQAAFDTVDRAREAVHAVPSADALVGGVTALTLDVKRASAADNRLIIPIILATVFLILCLLLRAITAPLILVATVVLSFAAAMGVSALVFRHVFGFAGADPSLLLFVFVFLVALGIDYNIFLMTRVREEALKFGTRRGALIGLAATGAVITSAGLVLAGTFAVLGTLPLVAFAEIGFAVAFGVLLDTIVVRSVLVTALNLDVGRHMWWPSALGRKEDVPEEEATPVAV